MTDDQIKTNTGKVVSLDANNNVIVFNGTNADGVLAGRAFSGNGSCSVILKGYEVGVITDGTLTKGAAAYVKADGTLTITATSNTATLGKFISGEIDATTHLALLKFLGGL
ncbi:MAG: hypothetical protein LBS34_00295 [Rickettsiales bacterium]|nr:hypothetical protein [Rickettsiales bacterium]